MALVINELSKDFGGVRALQGVSFDIEPGKIVGLIGPNGAGKTTCFNVITGFAKPSGGSVMADGRDITNEASFKLARLGVIRTFQHTSIFGHLTVLENVRNGFYRHRNSSVFDVIFATKKYRKDEEETNRRVEQVLSKLGLTEIAHLQANELSYGEQRRLSIAVAIVSQPKYLLLDEPAAGLNIQETGSLTKTLIGLRDEGLGILLVEHDMKMIMNLCDEIVVLASGKLLAKGTAEEIRSNKEVIKAYLGGVQDATG